MTLKSIIIKDYEKGLTRKQISEKRGIKYGTVATTIYRYNKEQERKEERKDPDKELVEENVLLKKQVQRQQDRNRIQNKAFRNHARISNVVETLHYKMIDLLQNNTPSTTLHKEFSLTTKKVGILQLSDLHLNEIVDDIQTNKYDINIASKRLYYFISKSIEIFKAEQISHIVVAITGDLLNSDRRISEITESATNRMNAAFITFEILRGIILHLNLHFNISIYSVTGNESRTKDYIDWTSFLASDSYDVMIHNCLMYHFNNCPGVHIEPIIDPIECIVKIKDVGILLIHGHSHKNIARKSANISDEIRLIRDKYTSCGIQIHYTLMGHIHDACISDLYARSSSLVGDNAYSTRALNCYGRASQNIFIVDINMKTVTGVKIDLQGVENYTSSMYEYNDDLTAYNQAKNRGSNIFIVNDTII